MNRSLGLQIVSEAFGEPTSLTGSQVLKPVSNAGLAVIDFSDRITIRKRHSFLCSVSEVTNLAVSIVKEARFTVFRVVLKIVLSGLVFTVLFTLEVANDFLCVTPILVLTVDLTKRKRCEVRIGLFVDFDLDNVMFSVWSLMNLQDKIYVNLISTLWSKSDYSNQFARSFQKHRSFG